MGASSVDGTSDAADASGSVDASGNGRVLFGTFTGVFTPTLLTIFGVIMYVRVGWAVGNAGLMGAWLVMLLALGITAATGLSLSSIATNTRIGPGGPYAIMSSSLGYEVGGSIGVPLYLTRPLGVAMYVIGFREGWLWVFPDHPPLVVDAIVFGALAGLSYISADLAFRVQYVIMAVVVGSLVSIFASPVTFNPVSEIQWWGSYPGFAESGFQGADFWVVFAVFFPATTGILAGANMSGDLKDPRRAIPRGTLAAIVIASAVYFALAWWTARAGTVEELTTNYTIAIDKALWPPIVLAGLLGATASSALAGLVGGPRILMAMGQHRLIPASELMAKTSDDGNPRAAILVTAVITFGFVMVRDLNIIAPLVTMFFLITYAMLNVVVLIEDSVGLVSYRPTLRIPRIIPLFGLLGCIFSMFIVNATFGLISVAMVVGFYLWIQRRGVPQDSDDVRSSIFVSVAQWAASRVTDDDQTNARAWKPNLLVPVEDPEQVRGEFQLLLDVAKPDGSITLLGLSHEPRPSVSLTGEFKLGEDGERERPRRRLTSTALPSIEAPNFNLSHDELHQRLTDLSEAFRWRGVQSSAAVVRIDDPVDGISVGLDALQSAFFRPNTLLLPIAREDGHNELLPQIVERVAQTRVGVLFVGIHKQAGFGQRSAINLWVRPAPGTWEAEAAFKSGNLNLNLLTGYRLMREWRAKLNIITAVPDEATREQAERFLDELCDLARFPSHVTRMVMVGPFNQALRKAPIADVSVFGIPPNPDFSVLLTWVDLTRSTVLFVKDSGRESALA